MNSNIIIIGVIILCFSIAIFFLGFDAWSNARNEHDRSSMEFFNILSKLFLITGTLISPIIIIFGFFLEHKLEPLVIEGKRSCPNCEYDIPMNALTCPYCGKDFFIKF